MPIEFVCKIKFAEEDEKQKSQQDGDKESLIEESCTPPVKDLAGFANSCSLHGINHIFVSGRLGIRQTLWALAFLTSLALFLYQAAKCAISYLEHPHVTALNEEATPEMVFPAVTICNINRFRFSALTDADIYHLANLTGLPPKNRDGHKPTDLMYPAPDMQDIFNRTGHQLEEMLMSCNFSGQNCSADDFSVVSAKVSLKFSLFVARLSLCYMDSLEWFDFIRAFFFNKPNLYCSKPLRIVSHSKLQIREKSKWTLRGEEFFVFKLNSMGLLVPTIQLSMQNSWLSAQPLSCVSSLQVLSSNSVSLQPCNLLCQRTKSARSEGKHRAVMCGCVLCFLFFCFFFQGKLHFIAASIPAAESVWQQNCHRK